MAVLVVGVVLAGTLTAGCNPKGGPFKLCDVSYTGLAVRRGLVVDTVRPVCDKPPQSHTLKAVVEFEWVVIGSNGDAQ